MAKKPFGNRNQTGFSTALFRFRDNLIEEVRYNKADGRIVELGIFPLESNGKIFVARLVSSPKAEPIRGSVKWFTDFWSASLWYRDTEWE
jgi:hypothetical protein